MPDNILLVSPASPFAPQPGAQQRSALLYEVLQTPSKDVSAPGFVDDLDEAYRNAAFIIAQDDLSFVRLCIAWLADIDSRRSETEKGHAQIGKHDTHALFVNRGTQLCALCFCTPPVAP